MAEAILAEIDAWFEDSILEPLATSVPRQALEDMFSAVTEYHKSGHRICLVGNFAMNSPRDIFSDQIESHFVRWIDALAKCLFRGGVSRRQSQTLACSIISSIQGAITLTRATNRSECFLEAMETTRADACRQITG